MVKSRDRTKIINSNSKISNLMRDLMQHQLIIILRTSCNYSDAFDQTCNLLGDERSIRWLSISCDTPKKGKWKWRQLLEFLDKEIKMQQQRAILQSKTKRSDPPANPATKRRSGHQNDYVQTRGPRGIKLTQHFSCKTFVEMIPAERLSTLKSKNLCYQCLFPGARANQPKHKEGLCQQDFICLNAYHQGCPMKNQILVCEKHKNDKQNQDTLEHYNSRYASYINQFRPMPRR